MLVQYPWKPEETSRHPGAGVTGSCEPPKVGADLGTKLGSFGKAPSPGHFSALRLPEMPFLPPEESKLSPIHVNNST